MASGDDRQFWKVVGGEKTGGIIVRSDSTYSSEVLPERLSTGAVINGLELDESCTRLRYELVSGAGPGEGWVTLKIKDKVLLVPWDEDDDEVEDLHFEPPRKEAESVPGATLPPKAPEPPLRREPELPLRREPDPPLRQEPEAPPPARQHASPAAQPQGGKRMFAWKNPNRDRNRPSPENATATAEPTPPPPASRTAPKPTPPVPAEKPSAYPEYPKVDKSFAVEKIGRPKPTPPPEPQIVKHQELPTASLKLPGNQTIEDVVDQMYQLRPGNVAAWTVAKSQRKGCSAGDHKGVPLPHCVLPCTAPDSAIPPGKRLVNIDFVSCSS